MSTWRVIYYKTAAGDCPIREYLDTLGRPHVKHLRGKIWELRTHGRLQHRVLYFAAAGQRLVLLHAFTKKTPKTPPREIDLAERRLIDYQCRTDEEEEQR